MNKLEQKPNWVNHFKLDEATWITLCAQSAQMKATPLDIALDNGTLTESLFLNWDQENSGLATLKYTFFNKDIPLELLKNFKYENCRQKGCMPIGEWDGLIYWAKLSSEPTGFETENPNAIWLLAPWSGLKKWFTAWEATLHSKTEAKIEVKAEQKDLDGTQILPPIDKISPNLPPPPNSEMLAALSSSDATQILPALDFSSLHLDREPAAPPLEVSIVNEPISAPVPKPASASMAKNSHVLIPAEELESSLQLAHDQETLVGIFMTSWGIKFDQLMIFLYSKKTLAIRWDNKKWKGTFKTDEKINLETPSIFKIVMDTNHPYHGYIVPSPVNDQFFKLVSGGTYPEHATLVPIVDGENIVGLILGTCTKAKSEALNLNKLLDDASTFSKSLLRVTPTIAKAA